MKKILCKLFLFTAVVSPIHSQAALVGCGTQGSAVFFKKLEIFEKVSCRTQIALKDEDSGELFCVKVDSHGKPQLKIKPGIYRACLEGVDPDSFDPIITAIEAIGAE